MRYDGIVLAGGEGRRLGGVQKPAITIAGRSLLDIAVAALDGAATTVVVGASMPTLRPAVWTREEPAGGGPVAALAAALPIVKSQHVVVLAADLPFVTAEAIGQLRQAMGDAAAVMAVDLDGRDQPLLACYETDRLRVAMPDVTDGASMRSLVSRLEEIGPVIRIDVGGRLPATWDCDTPADLDRARELA